MKRLVVLLVCSAALAACHTANSDWKHAEQQNTPTAYRDFLAQHPRDARAAQARSRIATLEDEAAWNTAQVASDLPGYQHYLELEPKGAHAEEARAQVERRERHAAWTAAHQADTVTSLQAFLRRYPSGEEADEARAALARIESYRAQLAVAQTRDAAEREQRSLERHFHKVLPTLVVIAPEPGHPEYRIASSSMSEQDADAACVRLKKAHHRCEVIQSSGEESSGEESSGSAGA